MTAGYLKHGYCDPGNEFFLINLKLDSHIGWCDSRPRRKEGTQSSKEDKDRDPDSFPVLGGGGTGVTEVFLGDIRCERF